MPQSTITIEALLEQGQDLCSLPEIYIRVSEMLDNPRVTAPKIGETVQTDPAISTRILKMVNSAYYGLPNQVSSISKAIIILGRERLKQILIGSVLGGIFTSVNNESFSMQSFWQHSIKTAIIARELAMQADDVEEPDALFTAGLLHDIGRLIIAGKLPDLNGQIEDLIQRNQVDRTQAEYKILGFTHAELGAALMRQWGFPDLLICCTADHHGLEHSGEYAQTTRLIYLSNQLSQYVPPIDESETLYMLSHIPNWESAARLPSQISIACQLADDLVFDVMDSLGMINLEISAD
jgi:putative nucleotidyltransferase with HDIG domain